MKKKTKILVLAVLTSFLTIGMQSCSKIKRNPASFVEGTYLGNGSDEDGNPIFNSTVTVMRNKNKEIEVSGTYFNTFTAKLYTDDDVIFSANESFGLTYSEDGSNKVLQFGLDGGEGAGFQGVKQ